MGEAPELAAAVTFVVDRFNAMLEADGAHLEVVAADGNALTIRYVGSATGDCEACVLDPDELEMLVGEALQRQGAGFDRVTVLR